MLDIGLLCRVSPEQFYGIEYEKLSDCHSAKDRHVADGDHQLNGNPRNLGLYHVHIPIRRTAPSRQANALTCDWEELLPAVFCSICFGNPPLRGAD